MKKKCCPDCDVEPGDAHARGCDVERCRLCGGQAISCDCSDDLGDDLDDLVTHAGGRLQWTGEWPGEAECREFGLYCRDLLDGKPVDMNTAFMSRERVEWHVPCSPLDEGAHADLNRLASLPWDVTLGRRVKEAHPVGGSAEAAPARRIPMFTVVSETIPASDGCSVALIVPADCGRRKHYHVLRVTFGDEGGVEQIGNELPKSLARRVARGESTEDNDDE